MHYRHKVVCALSNNAIKHFTYLNSMSKKNILSKIVKPFRWRVTLWKRSAVEYLQKFLNWRIPLERERPFVIYMTGMPRTGSSYMKNYLGSFEGLKIMPFEPRGFHQTWGVSLKKDDAMYVDKSTHYIRHLEKIFSACGRNVSMCCIVRDPRDQLASLFDFDRHPELPRSKKFWKKWVSQYNSFLSFAEKNPQYKFFLLRYEDLVRSPVEAKACFLRWVGFNVRLEQLSDNYSIEHKNDIQDDKVFARNASSGESIGRHTKKSDTHRNSVIENYKNRPEVVDLMERFGYFPDLTESLPEDFPNITTYIRGY